MILIALIMNIFFTSAYIVWFLSEILLNRLLRSNAADEKHADKNSLSLIWITVVISVAIAVVVATTVFLPIYQNASTRYFGVWLLIFGIILRIFVVVSLGKYFTVDVTIRTNHQLKRDGPYRYLRHPSYFASLLSFIGFGISLNNWLSLLVITVAIVSVFIRRIKIEETTLIAQFGTEYLEYKKSTHALIPFIY
jgi:protein-S-isoprenylcysteine O-methyltransferase Ste14